MMGSAACGIQMERGSIKRTLPPIKLLSLSCALDPLLRQHLKDPKPRHVMSWSATSGRDGSREVEARSAPVTRGDRRTT